MTSDRRLKKRSFTLLEMMIALSLILIASGFVGWKMVQAVGKKRFESDLGRLEARWLVCQRLAVAMQADWSGVLEKEGDGWVFKSRCADAPAAKKFPPLRLHSFALRVDGKKTDRLAVDFFSSGLVLPEGVFLFCQNPENPSGGLKKEWKIPDLFSREESRSSSSSAPAHPDEIGE